MIMKSSSGLFSLITGLPGLKQGVNRWDLFLFIYKLLFSFMSCSKGMFARLCIYTVQQLCLLDSVYIKYNSYVC